MRIYILSISNKILRWLPILILIMLLILAFSLGWFRYLSFTALTQYHHTLQQWTNTHYAASVCLFMLVYIVAVSISLPGASILTLLGGFLFGIIPGAIYVVLSASIGAAIIFLAVKTALGDMLQRKAKGWVSKLEAGFRKNAFNYLLFLRLIPLFPFWVINIVPALLNVNLRVFFIATILGIIPGTTVYVAVGNGLSAIFKTGGTPDLSIIFKPSVLIPILCLAALSLVPLLYQKLRKKYD